MKYLVMSLTVVLLAACAEVQDSAGKAFENAGSVVRSGSKKMHTSGAEGPGSTVENSAGKALENAGSAIQDTSKKVVNPDPEEEEN